MTGLIKYLILGLTISLAFSCSIPDAAQVTDIQIVRDSFGVPHIMAPTDQKVVYGLAWAQCEDDFKTLQEQMLAVRGRLGEVKGKKGAIIDFAVHFMGLREVVASRYETDLSPEFKAMLQSYVDGINNYAVLHPKEVLLKKLFPLQPQDVIIGYSLGLVELTHAGNDLLKIMDGRIAGEMQANFPRGSNAIAISKEKTTDGKTYLAINSHQPLEGWYSWYEAHLISEEGLNILGGTFPGGLTIFHGVNENLGWAHTVNHADFSDVFALSMHPDNKNWYQFDGTWRILEKKKYRTKVKILGFLKIPVSRKIYQSIYGPTFKTKAGFFSWRFVVAQDIRAAEQWYKMNKASRFSEFRNALKIQGIPSTNMVYADRFDNIYYLSNARLPLRNENYDWSEVLPGDTSATFWGNAWYKLDHLPQVFNPRSGYVFNTNNTPFSSSGHSDNPHETQHNKTMGFQPPGMENNRSRRFMEMISTFDKLSYEDFKSIKYDVRYPSKLEHPKMQNLELLLNLNPDTFPAIGDAINLLNNWDRKADLENKTAPLFIVSIKELTKHLKKENHYKRGAKITEEDCEFALKKAKKALIKRFGSIEIPLKEFQKHVRGETTLPIEGGPDVMAAIYSKPAKGKNYYKAFAGESYIQLVRFGENGVEIESINAYGSSAKPESPHFTDQMELFTQKKLKPMTLNKEEVLKNAKTIYSPLKVVE